MINNNDPRPQDPPWLAPFFQAPWLAYYRTQARKFFARSGLDPEDAAQEAQLALIATLRRHDGPPTAAFVRTFYRSRLLDLYRAHHTQYSVQRPRPPAWVQTLGPQWVWLWELVCLRWLPTAEVVTQMTQPSQTGTVGRVDPQWVESGIRQLHQHQACPERVTLVSIDPHPDDGEDGPELVDEASRTDPLAEAEIAILLRVLAGFEDDADLSAYSQRLARVGQAASAALALSDEERLLLKLRFQEECSVAEIAACVNRPHHQVKRQLPRVLERIRTVLERHRIGTQDLLASHSP